MSNAAGALIGAVLIALLYEANPKIGALVIVLVVLAMLAYAARSGALKNAGGS